MTTLRTFKKRRETLAAFLRTLKRSQFDMRIVRNKCGTKACIMGWMPAAFPKQMRYHRTVRPGDDYGGWPQLNGCGDLDPVRAARFFALPSDVFFYPARGYKTETAKQVAKQLLVQPYSSKYVGKEIG